MYKLIRANFERLWKSRVFWVGILVMILLDVYVILATLKGNGDDPAYALTSPDGLFMIGGSVIGVIAAVFIAFFIGTEYSDGTIRNKIIAGHSRRDIYFSNWVVCGVAVLLMHLSYMILLAVGGSIAIGHFVTAPGIILKLVAGSFLCVLALVSFFLLFAMMIHNKAITIAVLILLSFGLTAYQGIIRDRLNTPKYYDAYTWTDDKGRIREEPRHRNPNYPTGMKRKYYEFMYDFLPGAQMTQMNEVMSDQEQSGENLSKKVNMKLIRFSGYGGLIILITSVGGVIIFRRKDLK